MKYSCLNFVPCQALILFSSGWGAGLYLFSVAKASLPTALKLFWDLQNIYVTIEKAAFQTGQTMLWREAVLTHADWIMANKTLPTAEQTQGFYLLSLAAVQAGRNAQAHRNSQVPSADNSRVMGLSKVICCNFTILMPQLVNNTLVRQSCMFISDTFVSPRSSFAASQEATLIQIGWDLCCICYKCKVFFPTNLSLLGAKNLLFHTYCWVLRTSTTFE